MVLSKVDDEGDAIDSEHIWGDVSPGEKRRLWAGLRIYYRNDLRSYVIKEIGIAVTPLEGPAPYVASTTPNRNVADLFSGQLGAMRTSIIADFFSMSTKSKIQAGAAVGKSISTYLPYLKWAAIAMVVFMLLRIGLFVVAYLM